MKKEGFSLLEVLVALSILSMAVVAVFQVFSGAMRTVSVSKEYADAVVFAETRMREILTDETPLKEGSWTEEKYGYGVSVEIQKDGEPVLSNVPYDLFDISLTVNWEDFKRQRSFTLNTLKAVKR